MELLILMGIIAGGLILAIIMRSSGYQHKVYDYENAVLDGELTLRDVPVSLRTEAVCLAAVAKNGLSLEFVPETMRTEAVCSKAIQQNELAQIYVSEPNNKQDSDSDHNSKLASNKTYDADNPATGCLIDTVITAIPAVRSSRPETQ